MFSKEVAERFGILADIVNTPYRKIIGRFRRLRNPFQYHIDNVSRLQNMAERIDSPALELFGKECMDVLKEIGAFR